MSGSSWSSHTLRRYRYYGLPFEEPIAGRAGAAPQNTGDRVLQYLM